MQLIQRFYDPSSFKEKPAEGEDVETGEEQAGNAGENGAVKIDDKDLKEQDIRWLRSNMVCTVVGLIVLRRDVGSLASRA